MYILISVIESSSDPVDSIYTMQSFASAKLFKLYVAGETVSAESVIDDIFHQRVHKNLKNISSNEDIIILAKKFIDDYNNSKYKNAKKVFDLADRVNEIPIEEHEISNAKTTFYNIICNFNLFSF